MEKNDKTSIVIASIFLVILFGCLGFVIYIKITYGDEKLNNVNNNVDVTPSLTLSEIINSFNNSDRLKNNLVETSTITMTEQNGGFVINYSVGTDSVTLNGKYMGTLLSFTYNPTIELEEFIANIVFDEFVNISCMSNGYNEGECAETVTKVLSGSVTVEGLGVAKNSETETLLVVDTSKKIILYTPAYTFANNELISIETTEYVISGNNFELSPTYTDFNDENGTFIYNASIKNSLNDSKEVKVLLKVYDENKNELTSTEFANTSEENKNEFIVSLIVNLDDDITKDSIKYFSIDFVIE